MSPNPKFNSPRGLAAELRQSVQWVGLAAAPAKTNFDPDAYADGLDRSLSAMKRASSHVFEAGYLGGIDQIGGISDMLEELAQNPRPRVADQIFWDKLSSYYLVKGDWSPNMKNLTLSLQLRLIEQMIVQEENPQPVIENQLAHMPAESFMDGLTLSLKLIQPGEIRFHPDFYQILPYLKTRLRDHSFIPVAVEHIAAHQDLYLAFFEKVVKLANTQKTMAPMDGERLEARLIRNRCMILGLMGYSDEESLEKAAHWQSADLVPNVEGYQKIKSALALPPEFLCMLHEATGSRILVEMAEFALDSPSGRLPYAFLENMGISRPAQWHLDAQDAYGVERAIFLYEHAINTPGLELSLTYLNQRVLYAEPSVIDRLAETLSRVNVKDPDCRRKGQMLFDTLVSDIGKGKNGAKLKEVFEGGSIPGIFYGQHKELKGIKLESDLGM